MLGKIVMAVLTHPRMENVVRNAYFSTFSGSRIYWEDRYSRGRTSGTGSYGRLAEFKADVVNSFIDEKDVISVIEFGCGDGNQLSLLNVPEYVGLDISPTSIQQCIELHDDDNKSFFLYDSRSFLDNQDVFEADLGLSLEVIFHLVEDQVYQKYMNHLFDAANKYVIIYSSNHEAEQENHVKHRKFTDWIEQNKPGWDQIEMIENKYPYDPDRPGETSFSDFYIYSSPLTLAE